MELQVGDKIRTRGRIGIVWHYGVYVGRTGPHGEDVVHNSKMLGRVVLEHLQAFSGATDVFIEKRSLAGHEHDVAQRALNYVGQTYDLLQFNCEHLVSLVHEGTKRSPQLEAGVGALGLLAAVAAFWPGSTYYDSSVDRRREKRSGRFARG